MSTFRSITPGKSKQLKLNGKETGLDRLGAARVRRHPRHDGRARQLRALRSGHRDEGRERHVRRPRRRSRERARSTAPTTSLASLSTVTTTTDGITSSSLPDHDVTTTPARHVRRRRGSIRRASSATATDGAFCERALDGGRGPADIRPACQCCVDDSVRRAGSRAIPLLRSRGHRGVRPEPQTVRTSTRTAAGASDCDLWHAVSRTRCCAAVGRNVRTRGRRRAERGASGGGDAAMRAPPCNSTVPERNVLSARRQSAAAADCQCCSGELRLGAAARPESRLSRQLRRAGRARGRRAASAARRSGPAFAAPCGFRDSTTKSARSVRSTRLPGRVRSVALPSTPPPAAPWHDAQRSLHNCFASARSASDWWSVHTYATRSQRWSGVSAVHSGMPRRRWPSVTRSKKSAGVSFRMKSTVGEVGGA